MHACLHAWLSACLLTISAGRALDTSAIHAWYICTHAHTERDRHRHTITRTCTRTHTGAAAGRMRSASAVCPHAGSIPAQTTRVPARPTLFACGRTTHALGATAGAHVVLHAKVKHLCLCLCCAARMAWPLAGRSACRCSSLGLLLCLTPCALLCLCNEHSSQLYRIVHASHARLLCVYLHPQLAPPACICRSNV